MIQAGSLTERVTLQASALGRDAIGGPTETWADSATVWASVKPLNGRQINQAQQVGAAVAKAITIRWRAGVSAAMRVKFANGTTAKVHWVEEYRADGRIVIVCEDLNG